MSWANRVSFRETFAMDRGEYDEHIAWHHQLMSGGWISVLDRRTGFGHRDIETGYRSPCGKFWLASGNCDVRDVLDEFDSEDEMVQWVIDRANNCVALPARSYGITYERLMRREGVSA